VATGLAHHEKGGGLFASAVAAGGIAGEQRREQPVAEISLGAGIRLGERGDHVGARQDVPLYGEAIARTAARPVHAVGTRERGGAAVGVDEPDLALLAVGVGLEYGVERGV